jgi:hypothetical protein
MWPLYNRLRALEAALFVMGHDLAGNSGYPLRPIEERLPIASAATLRQPTVRARGADRKIHKATEIYQRMRARGSRRAEIIAEFVRAIPMSKACASTYYQLLNKVT